MTNQLYAARQRRDFARERLEALAEGLVVLAAKLTHPQGVRVAEFTGSRGGAPNPEIVGSEELITWDELAEAIREFSSADSDYHTFLSNLPMDQR